MDSILKDRRKHKCRAGEDHIVVCIRWWKQDGETWLTLKCNHCDTVWDECGGNWDGQERRKEKEIK